MKLCQNVNPNKIYVKIETGIFFLGGGGGGGGGGVELGC